MKKNCFFIYNIYWPINKKIHVTNYLNTFYFQFFWNFLFFKQWGVKHNSFSIFLEFSFFFEKWGVGEHLGPATLGSKQNH